MADDHVLFVLQPYRSYGNRMKPYWSYGDRIKPVELTRGVNFMCGCIYGLVRSHTVSHGLARSLIRLYTDMDGTLSVFFKFFL